ncbi:hypothetical protein ACRAWF_07735 [Streptomyces sp. L7]
MHATTKALIRLSISSTVSRPFDVPAVPYGLLFRAYGHSARREITYVSEAGGRSCAMRDTYYAACGNFAVAPIGEFQQRLGTTQRGKGEAEFCEQRTSSDCSQCSDES